MNLIVIGTGGLAREFSAFFNDAVNIVGYFSTNIDEFYQFKLPGKFFSGAITPEIVGTTNCVIAIGSAAVKKEMSERLRAVGFTFPNLIHPSATIATRIGTDAEGIIISPNCVIGSNVLLGRHVYLNFMVGVGHDTKVGDYVQVNPGAQIGGSVIVGNEVLIGSGATIRQGLNIKQKATVGFGSVVFTSVREGITVIGNPAKRLKFLSADGR